MAPDETESPDIIDPDLESVEQPSEYEITSDDRTWGILAHASGFVGMFIPLGNIIAPLLIWLIKKEESRFVDEVGRNVVNFQITWTIYLIVSALSLIVFIGFVLLPLVIIGWFVLIIIGAIRASNDTVFEYPLTINFIS